MKKLIIAMLGTGKFGPPIEQHNLFIGVGESITSPEVIEEMKESWSLATHLDDAVALSTEVPGYKITLEAHEPHAQVLNPQLKLFVVWIGWYEKKPQPNAKGLFLLNTEKHELFIAVAEQEKDILEKLKTFPPFKEGYQKSADNLEGEVGVYQSHVDNQHGILSADIDKITNVTEHLRLKGFQVVITPYDGEHTSNEFHGYGKFEKLLKQT